MTLNTSEQALWKLVRSVIELGWFVNNYRHGKMYRDGRVLSLFYVEPDSLH
jgi:hypothetical protein